MNGININDDLAEIMVKHNDKSGAVAHSQVMPGRAYESNGRLNRSSSKVNNAPAKNGEQLKLIINHGVLGGPKGKLIGPI